ncbi:hypothetical protein HDU87_006652 [Geranomyces variabilis]|uniref:Metallo-beta-lactamase domain-containing protein n=1 Tax=Geranomyces variabilis TaxID=109894 RepID=A0AAD5XKW0_9FUNG|nr:hypothetical protein HDU87_006652 [Geranomyces variabilis]
MNSSLGTEDLSSFPAIGRELRKRSRQLYKTANDAEQAAKRVIPANGGGGPCIHGDDLLKLLPLLQVREEDLARGAQLRLITARLCGGIGEVPSSSARAAKQLREQARAARIAVLLERERSPRLEENLMRFDVFKLQVHVSEHSVRDLFIHVHQKGLLVSVFPYSPTSTSTPLKVSHCTFKTFAFSHENDDDDGVPNSLRGNFEKASNARDLRDSTAAMLYFKHGSHVSAWDIETPSSDEDLQRVMDRAIDLSNIKTDCFLVIGAPQGLEQDLMADLYYMARSVEVGATDALAFLQEVRDADLNKPFASNTKLYDKDNKRIRVRFLWNPDVETLEKELRHMMAQLFGATVRFAYSGHGNECGCVELRDGRYSGWRLRCLFDRCGPPHFPETSFLLNCCFATAVAESMLSDQDDVQGCYTQRLATMAKINLSACDSDRQFEQNFLKCIKWLLEKLDGRTFSQWKVDGVIVFIVPTSGGRLSPIGALPILYNLPSEVPPAVQELEQESKSRKNNYYPGHWDRAEYCTTQLPLGSVVEYDLSRTPICPSSGVRIRLFQSEEGDSTLVQTNDCSVLIDGGYLSTCRDPDDEKRRAGRTMPAWRHLRHLDVLDAIILTHGDMDHAEGLAALMQRKKIRPREGPVVKGVLVQADSARWPGRARGWSIGNHIADLTTKYADQLDVNEEICLQTAVSSTVSSTTSFPGFPLKKYFATELAIKFQCLLPTPEVQVKVAKHLSEAKARPGRLTLINSSGIVLMATAEGQKRMLFTGDADGKDIAEALRIALSKEVIPGEEPPFIFDYVDIPHHGAKSNNLQSLLDVVKAKHLAISTNGENHNHPHADTITQVKGYLKKYPDSCVYLNYREHVFYDKKTKVRKTRNILDEFADDEAVCRRVIIPDLDHRHRDIHL